MSKNLPATTEHFTILQFRKAMLDLKLASSARVELALQPSQGCVRIRYTTRTKPEVSFTKSQKQERGEWPFRHPPRSGKPDLLGGFTSQVRDAV
jgi:hypothetical protein